MAQLLKALNALAGDSGLLPRTHMVANNILLQFQGGSDALFRPPLAPDTRGAHTFMQAKHSYTENKNLVVCQNTLADVKPVLVNITAEVEQMAFRKQRLSQYSLVFTYVPSTGT